MSPAAYSVEDLNAAGRVAGHLKHERGRPLIWGPARHGPGNNRFVYFHDHDGAMIELCYDLAQMPPTGDYQPRKWPSRLGTINQWGGPPPPRFLLTGFPIVGPDSERPSYAVRPDRTAGTFTQNA